MTINNRIDLIIKHFGLNKNSFSNKIGVNPTVIHNIIKGRNAPSFDILNKIVLSFDNIDAGWLLTGEGSMLREGAPVAEAEPAKPQAAETQSPTAPPPSGCPQCALKDKVVESQQATIDAQKKTIKLLEQELEACGRQKKSQPPDTYPDEVVGKLKMD